MADRPRAETVEPFQSRLSKRQNDLIFLQVATSALRLTCVGEALNMPAIGIANCLSGFRGMKPRPLAVP